MEIFGYVIGGDFYRKDSPSLSEEMKQKAIPVGRLLPMNQEGDKGEMISKWINEELARCEKMSSHPITGETMITFYENIKIYWEEARSRLLKTSSSLLAEKNKQIEQLIYSNNLLSGEKIDYEEMSDKYVKQLHENEELQSRLEKLSQPAGDGVAMVNLETEFFEKFCEKNPHRRYIEEHYSFNPEKIIEWFKSKLSSVIPTERKGAIELKNPKKCSHENRAKRKGWGSEPIIYCLDCDNQLD